MKLILKHIAILFAFAYGTSAFAQSKVTTKPTKELYDYYPKGENVEESVFMAVEYEALMARQGFAFLQTENT